MNETKEELGVRVALSVRDVKRRKSKSMYINRELVLCTLSVLCREREQLDCVEPFGGSGIAGLQWKKHLEDRVNVTILENNLDSVETIRSNIELNGFSLKPRVRFGSNLETSGQTMKSNLKNQTVGENKDEYCFRKKKLTSDRDEVTSETHPKICEVLVPSVELVQSDCNVILHQRFYDFIYLDPVGGCAQFLDATFKSARADSVVVITASDVGTLLGKCHLATLRNYGAYAIKSDYMKEFAARIVLTAAVRSAAKWNKGIRVLFVAAIEHFIMVAVKVVKGSSEADNSIQKITKVIHCRVCEERGVYPQDNAPVEDPHRYLACSCNRHTPGKTAVELGPVWMGPIFDTDFLMQMLQTAKQLKLSDKLQSLLVTMATESVCASGDDVSLKNSGATNEQCQQGMKASDGPPPAKKPKGNNARTSLRDLTSPPFYFFLNRMKLPNFDLPKVTKVVKLVQDEGYQCSRTHFDPTAIRTSANGQQLRAILLKHCAKT